MRMKLYYAVSKSGQGRVFTTLPVRNEHFGIFEGEHIGAVSTIFMIMEAEGLQVPSLTWKDDPVELSLELKFV